MAELSNAPFFIVGNGRSGTTLLQSMLSAHPRLAVMPETHFCKMAERISGASIDSSPPDFDGWAQSYAASSRFASLDVPAPRWRAALAASPDKSFRSGLASLLELFAERSGKPRIGEKTPGHSVYWRWLLQAFPEARLIGIMRDPRAQIASHARTPWRAKDFDPAGSWTNRATRLHVLSRDARWWAHVNGETLPEAARDSRTMLLRYEDLVTEPERSVRDLCAFLGEEFSPEMLEARSGAPAADAAKAGWDPKLSAWVAEHHASAGGGINRESLEKWRDELSDLEVAAIEAEAQSVMTQAGYTSFSSSPAARRRAAALARLASAADLAEREARRRRRRLIGLARR